MRFKPQSRSQSFDARLSWEVGRFCSKCYQFRCASDKTALPSVIIIITLHHVFWFTSVASLVAYRAESKWEAIVEMAAHGDELEHARSARRRRERRLRAWWRHEQFAISIRCAVASATHHSANRSRRVDAETQTAHVVFPQERITERIMEQTCDAPVPQDVKPLEIEYVAPALAVTRKRRQIKRAAPAPAPAYADVACTAPDPGIEYMPAPAGICAAPTPGIEHVSPAPAVTLAASAPVTAPVPVIKYVAPVIVYVSLSAAYAEPTPVTDSVAPVTESVSLAAADAAPDPVIDSVAPRIECMSPAAATAAPAPLIDSVGPVIESMSPAAADAAPDPVMKYVTSALAEPIPVDEHMSEGQLTTAVAALRQRETVLQSLLEAEASRLGDLLVQGGRRRGAACAQEDQTQEALT